MEVSIIEHAFERALAEALRDVLADEPGLHVRHDDLRLVGRPDEPAVEVRDRQELALLDRSKHLERYMAAR